MTNLNVTPTEQLLQAHERAKIFLVIGIPIMAAYGIAALRSGSWTLLGLIVVNVVAVPDFLSITLNNDGHLFGSLIDILRNGAPTLIIAVGMTLVIITGGIDLSVGSLLALASTLFAFTFLSHEWPLGAALAVALVLILGIRFLDEAGVGQHDGTEIDSGRGAMDFFAKTVLHEFRNKPDVINVAMGEQHGIEACRIKRKIAPVQLALGS